MSKGTRQILFTCFLMIWALTSNNLSGQSKSELETRRKNLQKEIEYTNSLLKETQKSRATTLNKVKILNTRIHLRNDLISSISSEIALLEREITEKQELVETLESDLVKVREEYEQLIVYAYWNKSKQDRLMFVLSADNFNQAYKRMKYIQQFTRHRKKQAQLIDALKEDLLKEVDALEEIIVSKEALAIEKSNESRNLQREVSSN